jgi:Na+/proline symporter
MKQLVVISLALCLVVALAAEAIAQRRGGAVYRGGSAAVRGPMGGAAVRGPAGNVAVRGPAGAAAVRGPAGNVAVRGPTNVYGGVYRAPAYGVAAGVAVGAAVGAAAAAPYYPPPYYVHPCGPPYTPYCP